MTTVSTRRIMVSIYVSIYVSMYLYMYVCIIYPAFVALWSPRSVYALKCSVYSSILTCSHAWFTNCMHWTTGATRVCQEDYRQRQVGVQTHGINGFSLLRQWSCSCLETCQRACVNQKQPMSLPYVLLFCDVHIDKGATLNSLQCLHVICGYRAVQTQMLRHHWHCCIHVCSYAIVTI